MKLPVPPSTRLDGKRALVTGASSGIGLGAAVALAARGAHVVCAARGIDRLTQAVEAMTAEGYAVEALALDISDLDSVAAILGGQPSLDVVVNAAGMGRHTPALKTTPEDYDAVMNVNLRGAYFLSTCVAEAMIAAERPGSIIHVSSQMGHVGGIDRAVYCASKHALEGMVKAMAIEWGSYGVRINTLCPTFIRTPLAEATLQNPERLKWIEDMITLGRVGEVEDIMGGIVYLSTDASALVTGTALMIDGGWTAH